MGAEIVSTHVVIPAMCACPCSDVCLCVHIMLVAVLYMHRVLGVVTGVENVLAMLFTLLVLKPQGLANTITAHSVVCYVQLGVYVCVCVCMCA